MGLESLSRSVALVALAVGLMAPSVAAQAARVAAPEGVVEMGEGWVRIQSPEGAVDIAGDWRVSAGGYRPGDADRLLVELGAVREADHIRLALTGDILFELDSVAIQAAAAETLRKVAQVLRERSVGKVYVVGHTDALGAEGYNQRLSEQRAVAVIEWLHRNEGVPAGLLVGRGMGPRVPVAPNTTAEGRDHPEGRAQNRRVEILIGTQEGVDLRAQAGVAVQVAGGAVRIAAPGGVEVAVAPPTAPFRGDHATTCTVGGPAGDCQCRSNATCDIECRGGRCSMGAGSGAVATFRCPDGGCQVQCGSRAQCTLDCPGGGCSIRCGSNARCAVDCPPGNCRRDCSRTAICT